MIGASQLEAAEFYAQHGLQVLQVRKGEKKPAALNDWQATATSELFALQAMFGDGIHDIGALLGEGSRIVDIECDTPEAEAELQRFLPEGLKTPSFRSARGVHRFFRWQPGLPDKAFQKVGPIEIRIGNRPAQTVLPSPLNNREWIDPPGSCEFADIPQELLQAIQAEPKRTAPAIVYTPPANIDEQQKLDRAMAYAKTLDPSIQGEGGDSKLWAACLKLVNGFGLTPAQAFQILSQSGWLAACKPEWAEHVVMRSLERAQGKEGAGRFLAAGQQREQVDDWGPDSPGYKLAMGPGETGSTEPIKPLVTDPVEVNRLWSVLELAEKYPRLREAIIDKVLRRGEIANIICAPKAGKSWLLLDLLLCIACGLRWLGVYDVNAGPVLLVDNELHHETLIDRVKTVAAAKGLRLEDCSNLSILPLRGKRCDLPKIKALLTGAHAKPEGHWRAIAMDAFYRIMPAKADENSNSDMTDIYNQLDEVALLTNAAILLIHHASKGNQAGKGVTDVGAGAGAQSRACDTHLILRQHKEPGVYVLDAGVRSWTPLTTLCMEWKYPLWYPRPDLDAEDLKQPANTAAKRKEKAIETNGDRQTRALEALAAEPDCQMTANELRDALKINGDDFPKFAQQMVDSGLVERVKVKGKRKNQMYDGFKLTFTANMHAGLAGLAGKI